MTDLVYYFSGTGNSLRIASDVASGLGNADLLPVTGGIDEDALREARRIGVVFPIYMYRPPRIVVDFIGKLKTRAYLFTVATFGGSGGDVYSRLRAWCRGAGSKLDAAFGVRMPTNYTPFSGALPQEQQQDLFAGAERKVGEILQVIRAGGGHFEKDGGFFRTRIHPGLLYKLGYAMIPRLDGEFRAGESCNGCGICGKVCPVANIVMEGGRPSWQHHCEQCLACLHWCPKEAIQHGNKTAGRERYHHPGIDLRDIMAQQRPLAALRAGAPD